VAIPMRNNKLALLGVLTCLPLTSCSRWVVSANVATPDSVPVRAALAVSRDVPLDVLAVGNVQAMTTVEVKSRIAGQIKQVAFEEGQNVTKGQLLFTIDTDTLQRQKAEQQAQLERDTAMEQQARELVAKDTAALKQSQSEADVGVELGKLGVLARQRVDQLVTTSETASSALRADRATVEAALGTINVDRARLAQTYLQLEFTNVVAPISGRAGAVIVKAGNMVRDNETTLVTLLQSAPIQVTFGVPEQILSQVRQLNATGALTVEVSHDEGSAFAGHLDFIDNSVDATTGTIRLKGVFPNADGALWPGEFVNVRLRLKTEDDRTVIPDAAVQDGLDGKYVWLVKSGMATIAPVTVIRTYKPESGPDQAIIGRGINPGDTVVTEGQLRLTSGAKIALLPSPQSFGKTGSTQ
jgi:multidrug efflux system membrane fusion protein